jgi:hypothetical protein
VSVQARPAFYALAPGGWRDYVTLLHVPYTLWHLSYVAIGAALAPRLDGWRFGAAIGAFALALGVAAHALDELHGRPLRTRIPSSTLAVLAVVSLGGAVALGVVVAVTFHVWLLAFVVFGGFIAVAYNLELFGGRFHGDLWFAVAWGAFPTLTGYFAMAGRVRVEAVAAAAFAALLSHAQRILSTEVRTARREVTRVEGTVELADGRRLALTPESFVRTPERALRVLAAATVLLALALLARHLA